jgi:NhaC family Na+:H+ antiporter
MKSQEIKPTRAKDQKLVSNVELSLFEALIPVVILVALLAFNVSVFKDDALAGSNQFILLMGGVVAAIVGYFNKVGYEQMLEEVAKNVKSTTGALLILLMVGALAGTWLISGVIPAMIYYGLQILNPSIFLAACVVICALVSICYWEFLDDFSNHRYRSHWNWQCIRNSCRHDCWCGDFWRLFWR